MQQFPYSLGLHFTQWLRQGLSVIAVTRSRKPPSINPRNSYSDSENFIDDNTLNVSRNTIDETRLKKSVTSVIETGIFQTLSEMAGVINPRLYVKHHNQFSLSLFCKLWESI